MFAQRLVERDDIFHFFVADEIEDVMREREFIRRAARRICKCAIQIGIDVSLVGVVSRLVHPRNHDEPGTLDVDRPTRRSSA